jgi:hypothetical protein
MANSKAHHVHLAEVARVRRPVLGHAAQLAKVIREELTEGKRPFLSFFLSFAVEPSRDGHIFGTLSLLFNVLEATTDNIPA